MAGNSRNLWTPWTRVVESPESESNRYFATRTAGKRIGAWSSDQSKPIGSREALLQQVRDAQKRFGVDPDAETEPDPAITIG